jgi:hypothetical protein
MQPLSQTKRTIYLTLFTIAFVVLIPIIILYSIGYRLNDALGLVKTGGIYVQSDIADTIVYVDGELENETGLFLRNSFIQNLRPGTYGISVEKEGYRTWNKTIEVFANKVTEAHLFMVPERVVTTAVPHYLTATSTPARATVLPNPDYVALEKLFVKATSTVPAKPAVATTSTTSGQGPVTDPRTLKDGFEEYGDLYSWLEKGDVAIEWVGSPERVPFYFCSNGECRSRVTVSVDADIIGYEWYPGRNDAMIIATGEGVYAIETDDRSAPNVYELYRGANLGIRITDNGDVAVRLKDAFVVIED